MSKQINRRLNSDALLAVTVVAIVFLIFSWFCSHPQSDSLAEQIQVQTYDRCVPIANGGYECHRSR